MKIKLAAWAALNYDPPPSAWTLRQWIKGRQIYPVPELVGSAYYVDESAVRMNPKAPRLSLVDRLQAAESSNKSPPEKGKHKPR